MMNSNIKSNRKKLYSMIALGAAFIAVVGAVSKRPVAHPAKEATKKSEETGSPVEIAKAVTGDVAKYTTVTGSLVSLQDVSLSSKMAGRLAGIYVREGDAVKAGEIAAR